MLNIVRNLVSSIFGKILLGLMVLSFALWGVGDILSSGNSKLAAKVGNQKISLEEFYNKFGKEVQDLNIRTGGQITIQEAYEQNIDKLIINDLVYEKMVLEFADKNKIYLTDNILKDTIKNLPQFIGTDGKFSEQLYRNSIRRNFSSEEEFLNELTFVYVNSLLFENFKSGNTINTKIIDLLYEYEGEERNIDYFIFNKNDIDVDFSDDELNEYYDLNKSKYLTEEVRTVEYIEFNLEDYKKLTSANNEDALLYYNENKDLFFEEEKRSIRLARFENQEDAENFFKVWSNNNSEKTKIYQESNNITLNTIEDLTKDSFEENVIEEIFNLKKNKISDPIRIPDAGFYVVKVIEVFPESQKSYEDVKQTILDELSYNEAYDLYDQALNFADELLLTGYDLREIALELDLETIQGTASKVIKKSELDEFIDNQKNKDLFSEAYTNITNYISDIILDNETAFIFKIININEPYIQKLDVIKDRVKLDLKDYKQQKILDEVANQFLIENQFKSYDQFKNYINSNKLELLSLDNIKRNSNKSNFEYSTIEEIFASNKGNAIKFKDLSNNIGILYLKEIISPKDKISQEFYNQVLNNIKLNYDLSIESIFGDSIIENSNYEIFIQNINNLFS